MDKNPLEAKGETSKKQSLNRAERRRLLHGNSLARELLSVIYAYFPDLLYRLTHVKDPRDKRYTTYDISVLLLVRILSAIFSIDSMQMTTEEFNDDNIIKNIAAVLKQDDLIELPHHDTINNCFRELDPTELEKLIQAMAGQLIRRNTFKNSRVRGRAWQILVDATELASFKDRHCDHCLFKRYKNKKKGTVTRIEYYHAVLEAKLVLNGKLVFSICTEFIENEDPIPDEEELWSPDYDEPGLEKKKQDSELKAFYRLAKNLKEAYPNLPICISTDSLYPCGQVFEICKENDWRYIMRFKEGAIPTLGKKFREEAKKHPEQYIIEKTPDRRMDYCFVNGLTYDGFTINAIECIDSEVDYPFLFITDLSIDMSNYAETVEYGRRRWRIENEGFKAQKRHGYNLKHVYCKDYNAMKVHYFVIQIAHAIGQLLLHLAKIPEILRDSIKKFQNRLLKSFRYELFTDEHFAYIYMKKKLRLD